MLNKNPASTFGIIPFMNIGKNIWNTTLLFKYINKNVENELEGYMPVSW